MLKNTFCHIPQISFATEYKLWASGIADWESIDKVPPSLLTQSKKENLLHFVEKSIDNLENRNPNFFTELLPSNQHWRLFPEFRNSIAYIDIETTGLAAAYGDIITTIAIYDGSSIHYYVNGDNLNDFKTDIKKYKMLVTYNGKCFDVPFIQDYFRMNIDAAHIDLRYVLKSLGYTGGLKGCERKLGLTRDELKDVDGYFAVLLWKDYKKNKNPKALETLLAYNIKDVVNLETLMVMAYNMKIKETPFSKSNLLNLPLEPASPFKPDIDTINRIKKENYFYW